MSSKEKRKMFLFFLPQCRLYLLTDSLSYYRPVYGCPIITVAIFKIDCNHISLEMAPNENLDLCEVHELKENIHKGRTVWVVLMTHQKIAALQSSLHAVVFKKQRHGTHQEPRGNRPNISWMRPKSLSDISCKD